MGDFWRRFAAAHSYREQSFCRPREWRQQNHSTVLEHKDAKSSE